MHGIPSVTTRTISDDTGRPEIRLHFPEPNNYFRAEKTVPFKQSLFGSTILFKGGSQFDLSLDLSLSPNLSLNLSLSLSLNLSPNLSLPNSI